MTGCTSEAEFLGKLYCVRLAFAELLQSPANRDYLGQLGRSVMAAFLNSTGQDSAQFCSCYDDMLLFLQEEQHWQLAEEELHSRQVWEGAGPGRGRGT